MPGPRTQPAGDRLALGLAVAVLTLPGVLLAHGLTTGQLPGPAAILLITAVTVAAGALLPTEGVARGAAAAAGAQLLAHGVLALSAPVGATVGGCLPALGRGARLGLEAAVSGAGDHCAAEPGGVPATGAAAAVLTALLILIGHGLLAGLTAAILNSARTVLRLVRGAGRGTSGGLARLCRLANRVPALVGAHRPPQRPVVPLSAAVIGRREDVWRRPAAVRRGPPVPACV